MAAETGRARWVRASSSVAGSSTSAKAAIAGWRLGVVMLFAMAGMAVGGWLGGAIFDATLSYRSAFQVALAFNLLNLMLLGALHFGQRQRGVMRRLAK